MKQCSLNQHAIIRHKNSHQDNVGRHVKIIKDLGNLDGKSTSYDWWLVEVVGKEGHILGGGTAQTGYIHDSELQPIPNILLRSGLMDIGRSFG